MGVVEFLWFRLVRLGAHWALLSSYEFVWFVRVRPGGCGVRSGLSGAFVYALDVVGVCRVRCGALLWSLVRLARPVLPWRSLGSFGLVSFVCVCPGGGWVRSSSSGCAFVVVGFVRVRLFHLCAP